MDKKPEVLKQIQISEDKAKEIEFNSLEVHVAISRQRHDEINSRFDRVEAHMEKLEDKMEKGFSKVERIVMWTAGTMFFTMLTILLTTVFGAKIL
mgnify:CR=1 FL=1|jgi:hypothetical protein|tara:strand:+ start:45411 stop:45695 length:285 start_codon:yes stop_codon:yes gene_type:complete